MSDLLDLFFFVFSHYITLFMVPGVIRIFCPDFIILLPYRLIHPSMYLQNTPFLLSTNRCVIALSPFLKRHVFCIPSVCPSLLNCLEDVLGGSVPVKVDDYIQHCFRHYRTKESTA